METVRDGIDPQSEREYDVRKLRDDFDDIVADWQARSESVRARTDSLIDQQYGPGERQRLDIFRCGKSEAPLLVFIHGGYWQRGDKSVYSFVAEPFLEAGCDVCLVNYTLCPTGSIPGITSEVRSALAWIWRNASDLKVSREAMHLAGHSAGGHLAGMMLSTRWSELGDDLPARLLASAMPMSGLFDLHPLRSTTINDALSLDAATAQAFSPAFLEPATDAPVLIILGDSETPAFHAQSRLYCEHLTDCATMPAYYAEPEVDHFDLINRMADSRSGVFQRMSRWIFETLDASADRSRSESA